MLLPVGRSGTRYEHRHVLGSDVPGGGAITATTPRDAIIELAKCSFLIDVHVTGLLAARFDHLSRMVSRPVWYS